VNESPLGLFNAAEDAHILEDDYGIPRRYLGGIMSPWAVKRLHEYGGDITRFRVVKLGPSVLRQIAVAKTEPGDENNQDISSLVGKIDIRKLEQYSQDDPDAYSYSGGLCLANRGLLEFVEMFKAPIKVLHPLLTATQEGNYKGTEGFGAIPFDGIVMAHSNESEWLRSRTTATTRPSSTASTSSRCPTACASPTRSRIYEKLLVHSSLSRGAVRARHAAMMAQFAVLSRLKEPENSSIFSKMRVYDGENLKDTDPKAKSYQEYRDYAGVDEGMTGLSTRFAFKILVEDVQLRPPRSRRQPGAPDVRARAADRAGAVPARDRGALSRATSRNTSRRATPSSSARRSRPPISRAIPSTGRTSSTAT
jgi:serine protein kinase